METLSVELLQVSLRNRSSLSRAPSIKEWLYILQEGQRQTVVGILSAGVDYLPENQRPPKEIRLQWAGLVTQIETRNAQLTRYCGDLCERMERDGFYVCVLKGQANLAYYSKDIANRRSSGDIDVWVEPKEKSKQPVELVINYLESHYGLTSLCWLHAGFVDDLSIPVEAHFRPSFMNAPVRNRRFQKHFSDFSTCKTIEKIDGIELPVMKVDEGVIYQMNHIYRHLIDEGVGLRQIVDYYWLLKAWNEQHTRSREETMKLVSWLGMKRFAHALMYVLHEVCGMAEELLICSPSEKDGEFLLNEIITAGNFGQTDPRMASVSSNCVLRRQVRQAWRRFKRNMKFLTSYPEEVIWEPFARLYHFAWKKLGFWKWC